MPHESIESEIFSALLEGRDEDTLRYLREMTPFERRMFALVADRLERAVFLVQRDMGDQL
jgi:hypothetical protein